MILCIAGSRSISLSVDEVHTIVIESGFNVTGLITGKARGIDTCGENWAKALGIPIVREFPADWKNLSHPDAIIKYNQYGAFDVKAGIRRNHLMADYLKEHAGNLIVIWNKKSSGSKDMLTYSRNIGINVFEKVV